MDSGGLLVSALLAYVLVLGVPGVLVGVAAGLRGWVLAALAPLLGYATFGLAGPWLSIAGFAFTPGSAAVCAVGLAAVVAGLRWAVDRTHVLRPARHPALPVWSGWAQVGVVGCVVVGFVVSVVVVVVAAEGVPDAVFQRWDPVFHANGIRYIAESGDGGLYGVSSVNRYGSNGSLFYPNAYHLAGSLVYGLTGASVPVVLNGITMPLAGVFSLSLVALVRQCGGRAVLAGCVALVGAAATNAVYESVANGLVPFALSIALTPLGAVALVRFVSAPSVGSGSVLALSAAGLLSVHSSALFAAVLFALPLLVQRWWRRGGVVRRDVVALVPVVVVSVGLTVPHLAGALSHASGAYEGPNWGGDGAVARALATMLTFQHERTAPQLLLGVLLVVGALTVRRLYGLRWVAWSAGIFGVLWVLTASFGDTEFVATIAKPWWNDKYRLLALVMIPLCVLAAHGLAQLHRWLARTAAAAGSTATPLTLAVAVTVGFGFATDGLYVHANATTVAHAYHNAPDDKAGQTQPITVSTLQREAMAELEHIAVPGERVLNGRTDGSAWIYALTGVDTVAGHFDENLPPPDAKYLAQHFNNYRADPEVRAAVQRLNIHHVFIGSGQTWPGLERAPGLTGLDNADFLTPVYRNDDAVIYRITP